MLDWLRGLWQRRKGSEIDEELRFHLESEVEANVAAGMTEREAKRRAGIAFGGVERTREQCAAERPGFQAAVLGQDLRYALRGFKRNPVFALTALLTLMLGIGATTAVFSVVDRILFRPLPYAEGDRLVSVGLVAPIEPKEFMLGGSYFDWQDQQRPFTALTSEIGVDPCDLTKGFRRGCTAGAWRRTSWRRWASGRCWGGTLRRRTIVRMRRGWGC